MLSLMTGVVHDSSKGFLFCRELVINVKEFLLFQLNVSVGSYSDSNELNKLTD